MKWRGRTGSTVVATAKLGKPRCFSRIAWKPKRCLQWLVIFKEVHPWCQTTWLMQNLFCATSHYRRCCRCALQVPNNETCFYHAFSGTNSASYPNICISRTWYLCFFYLKICKPHQWRLYLVWQTNKKAVFTHNTILYSNPSLPCSQHPWI